jgi:hypothetical protein
MWRAILGAVRERAAMVMKHGRADQSARAACWRPRSGAGVHRSGAATVLASIEEPALLERIPDQRRVPVAFSRTYDGMMCIQENGGIPKQA